MATPPEAGSRHPRPPRWVGRAAAVARGAALGAILTLAATSHVAAQEAPPVDRGPSQLEVLMDAQQCSPTGLDDAIPASALVRAPDGTLDVTTFDHGWAVAQGERPGTLVAVCLAPVAR